MYVSFILKVICKAERPRELERGLSTVGFLPPNIYNIQSCIRPEPGTRNVGHPMLQYFKHSMLPLRVHIIRKLKL